MNIAEWFKHLKIMEITLFLFQNNALLNFLELPSLSLFMYYMKMCCSTAE
jgi:hypothetical protein